MLAANAPAHVLSSARGASAPAPVTYVLPAALALVYYVVVGSAVLGDTGGSASSPWAAEVAA